jgi:hypothetical protein
MDKIVTSTSGSNANKNSEVQGASKNLNSSIILELIENAKKFLQSEDYSSTLYYLNLILLSPNFDLSSKIAVLVLNSNVTFKLKNSDGQIKIARKLFKYLKQNQIRNVPDEISLIFIKILQKASQIFEEQGNDFYACWFIYNAKSIYDGRNIKSDDNINILIKNGLANVLKKLTAQVKLKINFFKF